MNTTVITDDTPGHLQDKPGASLAAIRMKRGYTPEYVAGKLHLRVRIIELLEADDYEQLPEPVFVCGYVRSYAKLLEVPAEPLLAVFNSLYKAEHKTERALFQSKRETNRAEYAIRWLTGTFALIVLIAVAMWWYTNKENERLFPSTFSQNDASNNKSESEIRLTDLSKMRSLLSSTPKEEENSSNNSTLEKEGG